MAAPQSQMPQGRDQNAAPRVTPGNRRQLGLLNAIIVWGAGLGGGMSRPPKLFSTLARHRRLFRSWLRFAYRLMPAGTLPRKDTELVILRVAHLCRCDYERAHHEPLAVRSGLTQEQVDATTQEPTNACFSGQQIALLSAVDELHRERRISDATWEKLASSYSETQLIELCMLAGHYEMLAMTLNSLGVTPDREPLGAGRRGILPLLRRLGITAVVAAVAAIIPSAGSASVGVRFHDGNGLHVLSQRQLDPRLFELTLRSAALPAPANVRVLVPAGYGRTRRRYPVLYLLHGTSGAARDWTTAGDAEQTTAGLPLIVVMPDIALGGDGGGWCSDWPSGQYRWETFHITQLLPWIDANLRTRPRRAERAMAGLSQGGFCSTSYPARHPDLFGAALSYSGAPDIAWDPDARFGAMTIINATEVGLDHVPPNSIFGDPISNEINWAAHDPATLANNLRATKLYLYFGNGQGGPYDGSSPNLYGSFLEGLIYQDNIDFHNRLQALGIPSLYDFYGNGTHSWPYWARDLRWSVGPLMADFAHPAPPPATITYTSGDASYAVYGWQVTMHRLAREFSTLQDASCRSFTLAGSGSATVLTPPCLRPRRRYQVTLSGDRVPSTSASITTGRDRRLTLTVPLGPPNPYQQYTVPAQLAGTSVYRTRVTIAGPFRAR